MGLIILFIQLQFFTQVFKSLHILIINFNILVIYIIPDIFLLLFQI